MTSIGIAILLATLVMGFFWLMEIIMKKNPRDSDDDQNEKHINKNEQEVAEVSKDTKEN